jgi:small subunit ribosomal protein S6
MRQYETAFLITPKLEEEEREKLIEKMAEVVTKKKGKMVNIEKWGKRKLAYPIDKLDEAVYVFFHYQGNPDIPQELQRRFRQTESILRYLTLKKETQVQTRKKTKTSRKPRGRTEDRAKLAEDRGEGKEAVEETKGVSPEQEPEVATNKAEPEEIPDEEKE